MPLSSLYIGINDLLRFLFSNRDATRQLTPVQKASLTKIRDDLDTVAPFSKNAPVKVLRDKVAAHVDRDLYLRDMRSIIVSAPIHDVGRYLHNAVLAIMKLVEFDVYAWGTEDRPSGYVTLMTNEPWLLTLRMEKGHPVELTGMRIARGSPRDTVGEVCAEVVRRSQWMFRADDPRIKKITASRRQPSGV